jgi:Holliday junction DNA helicase RuvA
MIASITGTVIHVDLKYAILSAGGVGYKIFGIPDLLIKANDSQGKEMTVWTHHVIREDALDLYGFLGRNELAFFELLITVSGIGPKSALGIMSVASLEMLRTAITTGDTSLLTKVAGIGKKNAEKIVLELRDKTDNLVQTPEGEHALRNDMDALEALKSLGYTHNESRDALKSLDKSLKDTGAKVKAALKILGK